MTIAEAQEVVAGKIARQLTRWEIRADYAVHAVAIIAALAGIVVLLIITSRGAGGAAIVACAIYSAGLIGMLGCSAAYSIGRASRLRPLLRRIDQSAIFVMIAGSYTPFTLLHLDGAWRVALTGLVWSLAAFAILLSHFAPRVFERLSIGLYLALGWVGLLAVVPLAQALSGAIFLLLLTGGLLYTTGVVFHLWERLPFQTAIWHAFVVAAAAVHYAAVVISIAGPA